MWVRCICGRSFNATVDPSAAIVYIHCPFCGAALRIVNKKAKYIPKSPAEKVAERLRCYEIVSGILWLLIGIVQIFFVYTAAAGVWNLIGSILRLCSVKNIRAGNPEVVPWYEGQKTSLIIFAVVNIVIGAVVGVVLVAFDCWVRNYALRNKSVFTGV